MKKLVLLLTAALCCNFAIANDEAEEIRKCVNAFATLVESMSQFITLKNQRCSIRRKEEMRKFEDAAYETIVRELKNGNIKTIGNNTCTVINMLDSMQKQTNENAKKAIWNSGIMLNEEGVKDILCSIIGYLKRCANVAENQGEKLLETQMLEDRECMENVLRAWDWVWWIESIRVYR